MLGALTFSVSAFLTVHTHTLPPSSIIQQPLTTPPRPQILRPNAWVETALIHPQHFHTNTHTPSTRTLRPNAQADGVITLVIEDPGKDRKLDLVADIGDEFAWRCIVNVSLWPSL